MIRVALAALLLAVLVAPARADFQDGVKAYNQGDYAAALKQWKPLAEGGHGDAQNNLGIMYDQGEAVAEDQAKAVRWFRDAASQGLSDAQNNLGRMYELGRGVDQDTVQAHKWYNIAVAKGNDAARRNVERALLRLDELRKKKEEADRRKTPRKAAQPRVRPVPVPDPRPDPREESDPRADPARTELTSAELAKLLDTLAAKEKEKLAMRRSQRKARSVEVERDW